MQTHSHTDMLRYYYSKLTSIQKKAFDIIISCIQNYNNIIRLNSCNISLDEIFKLIEIIDRDYPELFYIDINAFVNKKLSHLANKKVSQL